jgi:hypothetical protein
VDVDEPSPREKEEICASIVKSPLFQFQYKVDLVNPLDEAVYLNLKENYPSIYEQLYKQQNSSSKEIVFTNPVKNRHAIVGNTGYPHSHVFACLTANRTLEKKDAIVVYFVSIAHELLFDHYPYDSREEQQDCHFIYTYNEERRQLKLLAIAEDPAFAIRPSDDRYKKSIYGNGFQIEGKTNDRYRTFTNCCNINSGSLGSLHKKVSLQVNYHMGFQHSLLFCRF